MTQTISGQDTTPGNDVGSWTGHPAPGHLSGDIQSRNMAAIALAEAMDRARSRLSDPLEQGQSAPIVVVTPLQRLQSLRTKLEPLYSAIPQDVEGIELGVVRENKPRLFLDMVAYVALAQDGRTYRLVQKGRNGEQLLHEGKDETALIARITDYIAHRLVLRERALESGEPVVAGATHFARGVVAGSASSDNVTLTKQPDTSERGHNAAAIVAAAAKETEVKATPEPASVPASPVINTVIAPVTATVEQAPGIALSEPELPPIVLSSVAKETQAVSGHPLMHQSPVEQNPVDQTTTKQKMWQNWDSRGIQAQTAAPVSSTVLGQASESRSNAAYLNRGAASKNLAGTANVLQSGVSWWLWPLLAVLLGMAFGAYLLYLYSISFTV